MDRCRCEEYSAAVDKLKIYTVGTFRPNIIDNYNRSGFKTKWRPKGVDTTDLRFDRPVAMKVYSIEEMPDADLSEESLKLKYMWCPYMTPHKIKLG